MFQFSIIEIGYDIDLMFCLATFQQTDQSQSQFIICLTASISGHHVYIYLFMKRNNIV